MDKDSLSKEVDHVIERLAGLDPTSEEYSRGVQNLKVLCEARSKKAAGPIDLEILLPVLGNLLGIGLILRHEQFNVVVSRAIGFIRPK